MKRGKKINTWYPFFIDKWLFGSTRHELIVKLEDGNVIDLRGIWIDLLTLSKKDSGYIRANETTPYPLEQLAGMFCVSLDHLKMTIEIAIEKEKLSEVSSGIYFVNATDAYSISDRWKREITKENQETSLFTEETSEKEEETSEKGEPILKKSKVKKSKVKESKVKDIKNSSFAKTDIDIQFEEFWKNYPREGRLGKKIARKKFGTLYLNGRLKDIIRSLNGYNDYLKDIKNEKGFDQRPCYALTFLNGRFEDFLEYKSSPRL